MQRYSRIGLRPGESVYTILRHVSRSGMFRVIDLFVIRNKEPVNIYAVLTDEQKEAFTKHYKLDRDRNGFKVSGCGMDMGFHLVYSLGEIVFGHGKENKKYNYHTGRNGDKGAETDGGYFLKQRWV